MTYHTTVVIYNNTTQRLQIIKVHGRAYSFDGGGSQGQLLMTLQSGRKSKHTRVQLTDMAGRTKDGSQGTITLTIQFEDGGIFKFSYNQCYALKKHYPKYGYQHQLNMMQNQSERGHSVEIVPSGPDKSISSGHFGSVTITITEEIMHTEKVNEGFAQIQSNKTGAQVANVSNKKKTAKETNKSAAEILNKQGLDLMRQQEFQKAIKKFNKAFEESEKSQYMANVAKCYNQLGKYSKALDAAEEALQCDPDDQKALKQKKIAKREIKERKQDKAEQYNEIGDELANSQNYQEGVEYFNKAYKLTKNPAFKQKAQQVQQIMQKQDQSSYFTEQGLALANERQYEQAVQCFNKALILFPQNNAARQFKNKAQNALKIKLSTQLNKQGFQLFQKGQYQNAALKFNEALILNPTSEPIKTNLMRARQQQKKVNNVQTILAQAIAIIQKDKNNFEGAIMKCATALRLNPTHEKAKNHLNFYMGRKLNQQGEAFFQNQKYQEALKMFNEAVKISPNEQIYKKNVLKVQQQQHQGLAKKITQLKAQGEANEKSQNFIYAIKSFEKILSFTPDDKAIINRLNSLRLKRLNQEGLKLCLHKEFQRAIQKFTEASDLNPNNQQVKNNLKNAKIGLQKIETAQRLRKQGEVFNRNNELDKAIQSYKAALQLNPKGESIKNGYKNVMSKKINSQGVLLFSTCKFQQAVIKFTKSLAFNPANQQIKANLQKAKQFNTRYQAAKELYMAGSVFLQSKQYPKALEKFNSLISLFADITQYINLAQEGKKSIESALNKQKAKKLHLQGRQLYSKGQFSNAFAKINESFNLNPNDQVVKKDMATVKSNVDRVQNAQRVRLQGNVFLQNSQFQKAIEKFTQALGLDPKNELILKSVNIAKSFKLNAEGIAYYLQSQFQNAKKKFAQAVSLNPSQQTMQKNLNSSSQLLVKSVAASQLLTEAEQMIKNNQYEPAIQKLTQIATQYSDINLVLDKAKLALTGAQQLYQVNKLGQQGESLLINKQYANAVIKFNQALSLNPNNVKNIAGLANAKQGLTLAQATKLNVEGIQAYNKGQYANAQAKFNQALTLIPLEQTYKNNLQIAGVRLKGIKLALQLNLQGVTLNSQQEYQKAINKFKQALVLDPSNEQFKKNIQLVTNNMNISLGNKINLQAIALYSKGQYKNAITKFNQALQKYENAQIRKNLESATYALKSKQANEALHAKIMISTEVCKSGIDCFKKDQFSEAIKLFDDAIKIHNRSIYHSNKEVAYLSQPTVDFKQALVSAKVALQLKFVQILAVLKEPANEKSNSQITLLKLGLDMYYNGCIQSQEENDFEAAGHLQASINVLEKVDFKYKKIVLEQYESIIQKYIEMKMFEHGYNLASKCSLLFPEEKKFSQIMTMIDQQNEQDLRQFLNKQRLVYEKYQIVGQN